MSFSAKDGQLHSRITEAYWGSPKRAFHKLHTALSFPHWHILKHRLCLIRSQWQGWVCHGLDLTGCYSKLAAFFVTWFVGWSTFSGVKCMVARTQRGQLGPVLLFHVKDSRCRNTYFSVNGISQHPLTQGPFKTSPSCPLTLQRVSLRPLEHTWLAQASGHCYLLFILSQPKTLIRVIMWFVGHWDGPNLLGLRVDEFA